MEATYCVADCPSPISLNISLKEDLKHVVDACHPRRWTGIRDAGS